MSAVAALWLGSVLLVAGLVLAGWLVVDATSSRSRQVGPIHERLAIYTLTAPAPVADAPRRTHADRDGRGVAGAAVRLTGRLVRGRRIEAELATRLDQAALPMQPATWILIHIAAAAGSAIVLGLVGEASLAAATLGLILGTVAPLSLLRIRADRRKAAFEAQLADSLQLLAGSLRAGYSVPQAIDAIVREGEEPVSTEFGRALVDARLGVQLETALESVAGRMDSLDFSWVVMALRIQRDVGGNLAEVMTNVAATLRERERLRRQVRVLSAEGRLSAWILGLLPLLFGGYLMLVRPSYLQPLWTTTLGWSMLVTAAVLFAIGVVWLRRVVRVAV